MLVHTESIISGNGVKFDIRESNLNLIGGITDFVFFGV